jgi:hypothetical protein
MQLAFVISYAFHVFVIIPLFLFIIIFSHILGWLTNRQLEGDTVGYAPVSGQLLDQRLLNGGLPPRRGYRDSMILIDGAGMCKNIVSDLVAPF